jgi:hypothetical protein
VVSDDVETIIRSLGLFTVQSDQTAGDEEPFGAVGVAIVSDQAVAIGVTAIPTPYTDATSDLWLLHQFWAAPLAQDSAAAFGDISRQYELHSKAMRKLSPDETVVLVVENGSASAGVLFNLDMRILAKLS